MYNSVLIQIFTVFINFFLSLPFTLTGLTRYTNNDIKAYSQPPGYVFGIMWSIIYMLFSIINYKIMYSHTLTTPLKKILINQSITEAVIQTLWLLSTAKIASRRYFIQYLLGLIIMIILVYYCFYIRGITLNKIVPKLYMYYLPYCIWIVFALILNVQIIIKYLIK